MEPPIYFSACNTVDERRMLYADSVQLTKSMDALNGLFFFFLINNLSDLEPGGKLYKGTLPNYF